MTLRRAIQVLIRHTGRDVQGAGVGLRQQPSEAERAEARAAVLRAWRLAYDYEPSRTDLYNLGFEP